MNDVVSIAGAPDRVAQKLWERVSAASQRVASLVDNIPWQTVSGERSRAELSEVGDLLKQAASILARTAAREELRYMRLERTARAASNPKDPQNNTRRS
jgi:hypothetical protein